MPNENERYVLFADILGFADFIETQEDLPHNDRWQQEILLSRPKSIQKSGVVNYRIRESWFISFHRVRCPLKPWLNTLRAPLSRDHLRRSAPAGLLKEGMTPHADPARGSPVRRH